MTTEADRHRHIATQLMNAAMSYARLILRRYGELGPFGFSMSPEGEIAREVLEIPRLPQDPARQWRLLAQHVTERARKGKLQAVAMGASVSLAEPSAEGYIDAVDMIIEVAGGYAIQVTVPYRIYGGHLWNLLPRRIALGKPTTEQETECRLFAPQGRARTKGSGK
ncbi:MAG TPA: hypothetical protein VME18_00855 [Acidobacteriaceae bacterium]|nr:hypothetical protein [Acidobacteriaceae bacterium]